MTVEVKRGDASALALPDASVDIVFATRLSTTFTRQREALAEFHRVLKPGGLLLFAESTRAYIESWVIRLLFRHPMEAQHSAEEYMAMVREAGFRFGPENVSCPYSGGAGRTSVRASGWAWACRSRASEKKRWSTWWRRRPQSATGRRT